MTKQEMINILKTIDIEELDLKPRAYNCLKNNNINTLYDLICLKIKDIKNIRNLGEKSLNEIVYKVHYLGLQFNGEEEVQLKLDNLIKFVNTIKKYETILKNRQQKYKTKTLKR